MKIYLKFIFFLSYGFSGLFLFNLIKTVYVMIFCEVNNPDNEENYLNYVDN